MGDCDDDVSGEVGGELGRDAAGQGDRGVLSDDRGIRHRLQPDSVQEGAKFGRGHVARSLRC